MIIYMYLDVVYELRLGRAPNKIKNENITNY